MKILRALLVLAVSAALGGAAFLQALPVMVMDRAMAAITKSAGGPNRWHHPPRADPMTPSIVRPSPDLAYSVCAYDLRGGPVHIHVGPGAQYWSLALYADNTDNFRTFNDREHAAGLDIVLVAKGDARAANLPNAIISPSTKGLALVRRLAPSQADFRLADGARQADICGAPGLIGL